MSLRINSDKKYDYLREQMERSARIVAQWPSWMIDQVERRKFAAKQEENEKATATMSSAAQTDR